MTIESNRKTFYIKDLKDGQQVADLFLISRKIYAETKAGKPYLALTLMDSSGEIEGRIWDGADQLNEIVAVGDVISAEASVKLFRDQLQLNINSVRVIDRDGVALDEFMPASSKSSSVMKKGLQQLIDSVQDPYLSELLKNIFQGGLLQQFLTAPAAKMMHHAYLGGLAEHTLSVTQLAAKVCAHYQEIDYDLMIAGALLHDIGKIEEFDFSTPPFSYTDSGRLLGHLVIGSEMVRRKAEKIAGFQGDRLNNLVHMILSHHGRHEFGSPCLPMTREAILLHHFDDMDAKMNLINKLSAQVETGQYQWSDYQRSLERFLWLKGMEENAEEDSAPDSHQEITGKRTEENTSRDVSGKPLQKPLF